MYNSTKSNQKDYALIDYYNNKNKEEIEVTKETCNKCGNEVIKDRKLDDNVWSCPNCGLEEYQSQRSSTELESTYSDKYALTDNESIYLIKRFLIDNIYNSAKLEKINITFPETKTLIENGKTINIPLSDLEKIINLRDAWNYFLKNINQPTDLKYICRINSFIARNESLEWGVLRTGVVGISGTDYIPPIPKDECVLEKMRELKMESNSTTEYAIELFLYLCKAQLFWDGNKRTAHIVANKVMLSNGNGILIIDANKLDIFNYSLHDFYHNNNKKGIKDFLYNNCIKGIGYQMSI